MRKLPTESVNVNDERRWKPGEDPGDDYNRGVVRRTMLRVVMRDERLALGARVAFWLLLDACNWGDETNKAGCKINETIVSQEKLSEYLGCAPISLGVKRRKDRKRQGDPWLWMLIRYGYISATKRKDGYRGYVYSVNLWEKSAPKNLKLDLDRISAKHGIDLEFVQEAHATLTKKKWWKLNRGTREKEFVKPGDREKVVAGYARDMQRKRDSSIKLKKSAKSRRNFGDLCYDE